MNVIKKKFCAMFLLVIFSLSVDSQNNVPAFKDNPSDSLLVSIKMSFDNVKVTVSPQKCGNKFERKFLITLTQPLDHFSQQNDFFEQRIFVFHKSTTKPVVFVTEGYDAAYAESPSYNHELCEMLDANLIVVEHRFFGQSKPENYDWKYLTVKQAAADHHNVAKPLKKLYNQKWISTGTSKGGTTALYHKALYPSDVDIVVPYVAPMAIAQEDPRPIDWILNQAADAKIRKQISDYQEFVLKNKSAAIQFLKAHQEKSNCVFKMDLEAVVEYTVFEYAFSFWQWGISPSRIPTKKQGVDAAVNHLFMLVSPSTFYVDSNTSSAIYYYQAYHETGYYCFNEMAKRFKKLSQSDYSNRIMAPKNLNIEYNPKTHQEIIQILNEKGHHIIQIHGEIDPWRYAAWEPNDKLDSYFFVAKGAPHSANYKSLNSEQKALFDKAILQWSGISVKR
jgi:hypothetical protein